MTAFLPAVPMADTSVATTADPVADAQAKPRRRRARTVVVDADRRRHRWSSPCAVACSRWSGRRSIRSIATASATAISRRASTFLLGTDRLGADVLSRLMAGARYRRRHHLRRDRDRADRRHRARLVRRVLRRLRSTSVIAARGGDVPGLPGPPVRDADRPRRGAGSGITSSSCSRSAASRTICGSPAPRSCRGGTGSLPRPPAWSAHPSWTVAFRHLLPNSARPAARLHLDQRLVGRRPPSAPSASSASGSSPARRNGAP